MSEHQPPAGTPEYLDHGSGAPLPPDRPAEPAAGARPRRGRRAWWIAGGVVALLGLGAGAWAALSFFQQGAQPAEALPASTVAYLSVDLDPSGGQKIDAFRTLNKFPAFKHDVGIDSVDELRHKLGSALVSSSGCSNLDYDRDIDPWLGNRAAVALVDLPGSPPDSVVVVQVTDEKKARDGISALNDCADSTTGHAAGFVVKDGWAVLTDTQEYADKVVAAADQGTLADDPSYQKWTKAVGDAGVVNAYASPTAGGYLARALGGFLDGRMLGTVATPDSADEPLAQAASAFKGGAATLRFTGDGLELAVAADGSSPELSDTTSTTGGALVRRLPDDTAAAVGISLSHGWLSRRLDQISGVLGGVSKQQAMRELSRETGLDVPDDIETLLGSGVALSVGKDFDFETAENSADGTGVPIAATVKGDPAAIEQVLDKVRARAGDIPALGSDSSGDLVAIGPTAAYRRDVLAGGQLGDDDTFRGVVSDAADASMVAYVNVDAFEPAITQLSSGDHDILDNLTPLRAIGASTWNDDGVVRFSFKVTTD